MSKEWLARRKKDPYYRKAKAEGYNSRAAFKLKELNERLRLFGKGSRVLDLGAAPGGWSQFAAGVVGPEGRVVAVDLLPVHGIDGVVTIQGDIEEEATLERIKDVSDRYEAVISDAAPKLSGNKNLDRGRALALNWAVLKVALEVLERGGSAVVKMFRGEEVKELRQGFSDSFHRVEEVKPRSSLPSSDEIFIIFRGFKGRMED